jgi:hypothetical protein
MSRVARTFLSANSPFQRCESAERTEKKGALLSAPAKFQEDNTRSEASSNSKSRGKA